jgi:hypothetical protein
MGREQGPASLLDRQSQERRCADEIAPELPSEPQVFRTAGAQTRLSGVRVCTRKR